MSFSKSILGDFGTDFELDPASNLLRVNIDGVTLKRDPVTGELIVAPSVSYSIVYFNAATPSTATIFDVDNPPVTNDNALKNLDSALYVSSVDNSSWNSNGTVYKTYTMPSSTEWNLAGTTVDAGSNKTANLSRAGSVAVGSNSVPLSTLDSFGSLGANIRTLADNGVLLPTDFTVLIPDGMTVTLPTASQFPRRIVVLKTNNYVAYVTGVIESLTQTITLGIKESVVLQSNGSRWAIIASYQGHYEASQQGATGPVKVGVHTYYVSDANWTSPLTLPASAPYIGFDLMLRVNSTSNLVVNKTNTDMAASLSIPLGKTKCFKWSGSYWILLN
jgi:hypothetical protein